MVRVIQISILVSSAIVFVYCRPGGVAVAGSAAIGGTKPLISLGGGNVGVNFGGYSASAGLGGLLSGDAAKGGLHAEAGTPHGQVAAAGLGGGVGGAGYTAGGLYALATPGGGDSAGTSLSGVSAGGGYVGEKVIYKPEQILSQKTVTEEAKVVHTQKIQATPVVHRTIIEKTVIPNYVEKTIQVPSYVEKTIRVPTVVEKKVLVEAKPTVYERTIEVPAQSSGIATDVVSSGHIHHYGTYAYPSGGFFSNIFGSGGAIAGGSYSGGAFGDGTSGVSGSGIRGASAGGSAILAATGYKQTSPTLFNDIFNIPISALGAVNNLLNNIGGRTGGGIAVSKGYSVGAY